MKPKIMGLIVLCIFLVAARDARIYDGHTNGIHMRVVREQVFVPTIGPATRPIVVSTSGPATRVDPVYLQPFRVEEVSEDGKTIMVLGRFCESFDPEAHPGIDPRETQLKVLAITLVSDHVVVVTWSNFDVRACVFKAAKTEPPANDCHNLDELFSGSLTESKVKIDGDTIRTLTITITSPKGGDHIFEFDPNGKDTHWKARGNAG